MTSNYLTTCYKSYNIISSTKAHIRLSNESSLSPFLIMAKINSLEFFLIKPLGELESKFEYQAFANIIHITTIPSFTTTHSDHLFILTSDFQFSIASVNENQIMIDCYGDILFKELDQRDNFVFIQDHVICSNNFVKGYIGLLLYRNYIILIPWKMSENKVLTINKACKIKLNPEYDILSLVELGSTTNVLSSKNEYFVGGLFQYSEYGHNLNNNNSNNFFKIYKIEDVDGEIKEPGSDEGWAIKFPEAIHKIIFMKGDRFSRGLLAFGLNNVYFYLHETKTKYEKRAISLTIGEHVVVTNQENFLILSDQKSGCLFLFVIDMTDSLTPLEIKYLGRIGVGSTLQYLDKKTIFLGSVTDNSYVLRILDNGTKDDNEMPYLSIIQTYQNLGNIIGMDLIDFDQDNKRLILASPEKQESLNLFQKGMQMSFSLMIKIPVMVKSLFWLFNKNIALCEIDKKCFFLQKTKDELHFLKEENFPLLFAFENQDKTIIISVNKIVILDTSLQVSSEILYASPILLASKSTNYLSLIIQEINCFQLQIYSMDLHLLKNIKILKPVSAIYNNDSFVFLGYWFETTLDCCKISNPGQIQQIEIGVQMSKENEINMKTNSVSCIKIWEEKFLLIGLNNGSLIIKKFEITAEENLNIFQTKYLLIGDRNIKIFHYTNGILICCEKTYALKIFDKPGNFIVEKIWVRSEKEIYSVLEIPESNQMQLENEENITNMILVTNYGIAIGSLDLLTKYMITPFGEDNDSNNRQIRDPEIKSFNNYKKSPLTKELVVVGSIYCITANNNINFDDPIKSELIVYSLKTQEILDSFNEFEEGEQISHLLYDESKDLIICTTDTLQASEKLPNELFDEIIGRIYLFYLQKENYLNSYKQKILKQIKKIEMRNPIESIKKMKENLLIFYCGSILYIYELIKKDKFLPKFDFHEIHKHDLRLTAFQLDVFEDFLIVCDPYKNVNLYNYNQEDNKLIFVAKIFLGGHLTFSSFYSKEKILCFDDNGNLIICQRKKKAETDLEKISLQVLSGLNFGEKLSNVVKINNIPCPEYKNILNKPETKTEKYSINEIIWTTESGSIGILAELPRDLYNLLKDLQESLLQEIKGKGFFGFEYEKWRQVKDFLGNRIQNNFVDGEIIKQFSQMPLEIVEKILNRMSLINKPKLSDFLLLVEDLEKKLFS